MDPWELATLAVSCATLAFLLGTFWVLRTAIPRLIQLLPQIAQRALFEWAFDEAEAVGADGKKTTVAKPSPRLTGALDVIMPALITHGIAWAQKNIKPTSAIAQAGPAIASMGPEALKMVPKEWRGIAQLLLPYLPGFLSKLGPARAGPAAAAAPATGNPFVKDL